MTRVLLWHEHTTSPGQGGGGAEAMLRDLGDGLKRLGHSIVWLQSAQIAQAVETYRPDVVQVMTVQNAFGLSGLKWLQRSGVPHVLTAVDYWPFCLDRNLLVSKREPCSAVRSVCDNVCGQRAEWQSVVNGSPVATLNEHSAAILRRNGVRCDYVAELGVDGDAFRPGDKGKGIYTSSAWGGHPGKGWSYLAEAVKGSGMEVNLLTGLPRERVAEELRKADIFVFPSIYEETWGLCLTEAMASGCACIASDVAGARAQMHEGLGILVPARDAKALRGWLEWLLANPAAREEYGQAAREHVVAEHSLEAMGRRWLAVYEQVISGGN